MLLKKIIFSKLSKHFRKPQGFLGKIAGKQMDQLNDKQNKWVLSLLNIKNTDTILEIGYGTGRTIQKLAKTVKEGKIIGIDFSETMFKVATKANKDVIKEGRVQLLIDSVEEKIPCGKNLFDKVIAVHVVYFWNNLKRVFDEIYRVTKQNGAAAIYLVHPTLSENEFFISYTPEEIQQAMESVSFKKVEVKQKKFGQQNGVCLIAYK